VRVRKSVVQAAALLAAALLAGALAWAFVIQPQLRGAAHAKAPADPDDPQAAVRPADVVAKQPASYDRLAAASLPPPRFGQAASPTPATGARPGGPTGAGRSTAREAAQSGLFFPGAVVSGVVAGSGAGERAPAGSAPAAGASANRSDYAAVYNSHALLAPLSPFELKAGAVVPAALLTAVDTARAGPVAASVTQNVFDSVSGRYLLIPQGARLIGRHNGEAAYGDHRAFLTWDRLILPNGKSLVLTEEPGVDAQGAVGVRGQVDRRLGELAMATLFAGAITTLGTIARNSDHRGSGGVLGDVGDAAAIEAAQIGGRLVDRELQVHPSIRLDAGAPVRVLLTRDLILEPYRP
jgi:type IV secretion system protein VirB10